LKAEGFSGEKHVKEEDKNMTEKARKRNNKGKMK
jgi:hypothetical protein